jgi:[acyl-carrier-protein] S-malonyltransferase
MAAIIGMSCEEAETLCMDFQETEKVVSLAIHNAPSQVVVSGHAQAVNNAIAAAKSKTAVQAIRLPISVPCHCVLLKEAAERFRSDLDRVEFRDFQVPVIPNCDPDSFHSRENTRDLLVRQITSPVRWQETIKKMADLGVDTIVELGPKRTLSNLIKRIDKRIRILNIENLESMHRTVAALKNS